MQTSEFFFPRTGCSISFERLSFLEHLNHPDFNTTVPYDIATECCVNSTCIVDFGNLTKESAWC